MAGSTNETKSVVTLLSSLDERKSLEQLGLYLSNGNYRKVYEILKVDSRTFGMSSGWTKKVFSQLSTKVNSDIGPWDDDEHKHILLIMDELLDTVDDYKHAESTNIFWSLFTINKKLLTSTSMWDYALQGKLLLTLSKIDFVTSTDVTKSRIKQFHESMYGRTWNQLAIHYVEASGRKNLEKFIMSIRWLLATSIENLPKAVDKLWRRGAGVTITVLQEDLDLFRSLTLDLFDDYASLVNKERPKTFSEIQEFNSILATVKFSGNIFSVISDCYIKQKQYRKCLEYLAEWLVRDVTILDEHFGPFDLFNSPCLDQWGTHWARVKREADSSEISQLTVYDVLNDIPNGKDVLIPSLLLELNSYFVCKYILAEAIVSVGEHLEDFGRNECEIALGLISQAIGFWWDSDEKNIESCILACENALTILEKGAEKNPTDVQIGIVSGVGKGWLAMMYARSISITSKRELSSCVGEDTTEDDARKEEGPDDLRNIFPGVSSFNINHEHIVATLLASCIDALYTIVQFGKPNAKTWFDLCPALFILTAQLCASRVYALGDTYTTIRAYHVCYMLCDWYDSKYNQLVAFTIIPILALFSAGLELIKLVPCTSIPSVDILEELIAFGKENANSLFPKTFFLGVDLAKSAAALHRHEYKQGINYLSNVLTHVKMDEHLDVAVLVIIEAYLLLAKYKLAQENVEFDMSPIEPYLVEMAPSTITLKSYRGYTLLPRTIRHTTMGWINLVFNQRMLANLLNMIPEILKILHDAGCAREIPCFASDSIHLCQSYGYISRTLEPLIVLAEVDLASRRLDFFLEKVDVIHRMLTAGDIKAGAHMVHMIPDDVLKIFTKLQLTADPNLAIPVPPSKVTLPVIQAPESERSWVSCDGCPDPSSPTVIARNIRLPKFLHHSLSCSCYVCMHPRIIPRVLKYLSLMIRYATIGDDVKTASLLASFSKCIHLRASLRILIHFDRLCLRLSQAFVSKEIVRDALHRTYLAFMTEPVYDLLLTLAESTPSSDIEFIIKCRNDLERISIELGIADVLTTIKPLEILYTAVYEKYFLPNQDGIALIRDSMIRSKLLNPSTTSK